VIDLWHELEGKLGSRADGRPASPLAAVNDADAGWLRRAETSNEIEAALALLRGSRGQAGEDQLR
jgi:hypothetical protein